MSETKKCPFCAEEIALEAIKCKHCGEFLNNTNENNSNNSAERVESKPLPKNKIVVGVIILIVLIGIIVSFNKKPKNLSKEEIEKNTDEIIALNYAATIASSVATFYAQSQIVPTKDELNEYIVLPSGYDYEIGDNSITVFSNSSIDFNPQQTSWRR